MPKTDHKPIVIKGLTLKKPAVLVDLEEYEGMKETLEILHEEPDIISKLKEAEKGLEKGMTTRWEKLKSALGL